MVVQNKSRTWQDTAKSVLPIKPKGKGGDINLGNILFVAVPSAVIGLISGVAIGKFISRGGSETPEQCNNSASKTTKSRKGIISRGSTFNKSQNSATSGSSNHQNSDSSELKMVLVVRQDLKMGSGKIAAQCAHAAVGTYNELQSKSKLLLRRYEECGQPKIVVTCKNQSEMNELKGSAQGLGLPTFIVSDAGRTQVAAGSKTVLAVGPGPKNVVDTVTGHLKLLK